MPTNLRGTKLYKLHYTLIGRIVYHVCKLETKQLQNIVNNVINLSKVKRKKTKRKTKRKTKKIVGKIYHTKNGQPYKILASGKARFVKK